MKNTIILFAIIAVIGFSFVSCVQEEQEEKDGVLPAGTYTTTKANEVNAPSDQTNVAGAVSVLNGITSPSFTVDADGSISALSLGAGGSAFITWAPTSGIQYRFTVSGINLNFQIKQGNSFVNWSPKSASINTVNYNQSIYGMLLNDGIVQLRLEYQRTDNSGTVDRTYELKKQ